MCVCVCDRKRTKQLPRRIESDVLNCACVSLQRALKLSGLRVPHLQTHIRMQPRHELADIQYIRPSDNNSRRSSSSKPSQQQRQQR